MTALVRRLAPRAGRSLLAALCLSVGPALALEPLAMRELAQGVFVHRGAIAEIDARNRGDIANIGFVIGKRCVAVIDTGGSLQVGQALRAALRARSDLPVCYVINTHMHLDHVFGNAAFDDGRTVFVASARLPQALSARAADYARTLEQAIGEPAGPVVYPGLLVDTALRLDLGGRTLVLSTWPTAHTNNDLTVYDETSQTLWLGDLLFDGFVPIIDGSVRGWLKVMDQLAALPARRIVPGHGSLELAWPEALQRQRSYLENVSASVRLALQQHRSLSEVIKADDGSGERGWQLAERFHQRNLSAVYTELEWED